MTPTERAARVQAMTTKATKMPTPGRVLEVVAEVSILLGEWGEILEQLQRASNEQRDTGGKT